MSVAAVLLAAGGGRRFRRSGGAGHKLLAELGGQPLARLATLAALQGGLDEVFVVTGAAELSRAVAGLPVRLVPNPRWAEGMATSLAAGVGAARGAGHRAVVVGLADQPRVPPSAWAALAAAPDDPPIAVASYHGRRGNPVRISAAAWDLLPTVGDEGARALMARRPDLVVEIACEGDPADIDVVEDLQRWS